jgi:hypothetical protein
MTVNSFKGTQEPRFSLYKSGFITSTLNAAIAANSFTSLLDVDVSKLDTSKLEIFVYGHRIDSGQDYATIPNQGTLALINLTTVLLAAYKLTGSLASIGYTNPGGAVTPAAPFQTANLSYFIFTY